MHKILVVDDELPIREWIKMILEKEISTPCEINCVSSAEEALELYDKDSSTLLIVDIKMRDMSGIDLLKRIKEYHGCVYFVILTSYSDFNYARDALKYGANEYILKTEVNNDTIVNIYHNYCEWISSRFSTFKKVYTDDYFSNIKEEKKNSHVYFAISLKLHKFEDFIDYKLPKNYENVVILFDHLNTQYFLIEILNKESLAIQYDDLYNIAKSIANIFSKTLGLSGFCRDKATAIERASQALSLCFYYISSGVIMYSEKKSNIEESIQLNAIRDQSIREIYNDRITIGMQLIFDMLKNAKQICFTDISLLITNICDILKAFKLSLLNFISQEQQNELEMNIQKVRDAQYYDDVIKVLGVIKEDFNPDTIIDSVSSTYCKRAIQLIHSSYAEEISLNEVVKKLNINQEYFCRIFKKETKQTFTNYLTNYRIKKAKELLIKTDEPINKIAESVGFSSLAYFSRVFKKIVGQNPIDYRNA